MTLMEQCPRWDGCSAPICPLGAGGIHLRGEAVCHWLMELVKPGGEDRLRRALSEDQVKEIIEALPGIRRRFRDISARLTRASRQGSKAEHARKVFHKSGGGR